MFQIRVKVSNPTDRSRFFEENFGVDTGALYSFVPEGRLQEINGRGTGYSPLAPAEYNIPKERMPWVWCLWRAR